MYISNHQIYNSNVHYAHKSYISNTFKRAISAYKRVWHCKGYDYGKFLEESMEAPLLEPFLTRRIKMVSRPDGFLLYGKLKVDFFSTSELYRNNEISPQIIRPEIFFLWLAKTATLVLDGMIVHFRLVVLLSKTSVTKKWTCLNIHQ